MSSWIGNVTPGSINLVRSGGDTRWGPLLASGAATAALVTFVAMFGDKIALVLTVVAVTILVLGFAYLAREVGVTWPRQRRQIRAFTAQVDAEFDRQAAALEASGPLHVTAERVRELEPATPYVVDLEREAVPVELDALRLREEAS